jgi:cyanophycinase
LAFNPFVHGLGLDEDTAAFIAPDRVIEVVGSGGLTIIDVGDLQYSSMARADEDDVVELVGVKLHVLTHGSTYDLENRVAKPRF